ncbi:MAG: hypothetical protein HUJ63_02575 [Enterococcus sp.]|nr:hypothetical protein [Enterococcus sp.]
MSTPNITEISVTQATVIGRWGEKYCTEVKFPIPESWLESPELEIDQYFVLVYQRPDDTTYQVQVELTEERDFAIWKVSDVDLAYEGNGKCQLVCSQANQLRKSPVYNILVIEAIQGDGEPPIPPPVIFPHADWSIDEPLRDGYIKNRPFYDIYLSELINPIWDGDWSSDASPEVVAELNNTYNPDYGTDISGKIYKLSNSLEEDESNPNKYTIKPTNVKTKLAMYEGESVLGSNLYEATQKILESMGEQPIIPEGWIYSIDFEEVIQEKVYCSHGGFFYDEELQEPLITSKLIYVLEDGEYNLFSDKYPHYNIAGEEYDSSKYYGITDYCVRYNKKQYKALKTGTLPTPTGTEESNEYWEYIGEIYHFYTSGVYAIESDNYECIATPISFSELKKLDEKYMPYEIEEKLAEADRFFDIKLIAEDIMATTITSDVDYDEMIKVLKIGYKTPRILIYLKTSTMVFSRYNNASTDTYEYVKSYICAGASSSFPEESTTFKSVLVTGLNDKSIISTSFTFKRNSNKVEIKETTIYASENFATKQELQAEVSARATADAGKVDVMARPTDNRVYAYIHHYNASGVEYDGSRPISQTANANDGATIVQRTPASQVNVAIAPTENAHATSKKYVDGVIATCLANAKAYTDSQIATVLNTEFGGGQ